MTAPSVASPRMRFVGQSDLEATRDKLKRDPQFCHWTRYSSPFCAGFTPDCGVRGAIFGTPNTCRCGRPVRIVDPLPDDASERIDAIDRTFERDAIGTMG